MKAMLNKLLHIVIMPCSHVPELLERQNAKALPFHKRVRLAAHLSLCKLCAVYALKVELIDKMLTKKYANKGKEEQFDDSELQLFKERMKKKLGKKS